MDTDLDPDLSLALSLADAADEITTPRFRSRDLQVDTKPDLTPVTEADRAVEEALRDRIDTERPGDAVLGEELGESAGTKGDGERRWLVDPIDATKNFVRGLPVWATLIALEREGAVDVGVVSAPALGRRWWAVRGRGAFVNGDRIEVSSVRDLSDAHVGYDDIPAFERHGMGEQFLALARRSWRTRGFGDFWQHVLVAEGALDVAVEPSVAPWDLGPLIVIVEEAGGRLTDLSGRPRIDGGSVVTSNGLLHDAVLEAMAP